MGEGRDVAEAAIAQVLVQQWDASGDYAMQAHEVYNLLARGASDIQVERHLRHVEQDELHQPVFAERDITATIRALRKLERTVI